MSDYIQDVNFELQRRTNVETTVILEVKNKEEELLLLEKEKLR